MSQERWQSLGSLNIEDGAHAGLLLTRYLQTPIKAKEDDGHKEFLDSRNRLFKAASTACGKTGELYRQAYARWEKGLPSSCQTKVVKVEGRMIIGLGTASPMETGLRLHRVYGTPVIPGSALKGLAAHYCDQVWGKTGAQEKFQKKIEKKGGGEQGAGSMGEYYEVLFGSTGDRGHIIFHDAWILHESLSDCLQLDVITTHHENYYQGSGQDDPPSDFDDPNPVPFLSVKGQFLIAVACDTAKEKEDGNKWAKLSLELLLEALECWGIGGKTNSGYGRLA